jgi:hypothetical protein
MSGNFDTRKDKYYQSLATDFQMYEMACDLQNVVLTPMVEEQTPMVVDSPTDSDLVI